MKQKRAPSARLKYPLLVVCATFIVTVIGRLLWWWHIVTLRLIEPVDSIDALFIFFPAAVLIYLLIAFCIAMVVWFIDSHRRRGLVPSILLVVGLFIVFQLPMPPDPPTPEMKHFLAYRANYEAVVDMARQNKLKGSLSNGEGRYAPPDGFEHVSEAFPLEVKYESGEPRTLISIVFFPFEFPYHSLVYYVNDDDTNPCSPRGHVEQTIAAHWSVCEWDRDWD